jgi:hypothetical protein
MRSARLRRLRSDGTPTRGMVHFRSGVYSCNRGEREARGGVVGGEGVAGGGGTLAPELRAIKVIYTELNGIIRGIRCLTTKYDTFKENAPVLCFGITASDVKQFQDCGYIFAPRP